MPSHTAVHCAAGAAHRAHPFPAGQKNTELVLGPRQGSHRGHTASYLGKGVLEQLQQLCEQLGDCTVFVNTSLTGVQHRNLQRAVARPVLDRVSLIIGIFAQRALTKEAKLQVELARIQHMSSMLVRVTGRGGERTVFGDGTEVVSARCVCVCVCLAAADLMG